MLALCIVPGWPWLGPRNRLCQDLVRNRILWSYPQTACRDRCPWHSCALLRILTAET